MNLLLEIITPTKVVLKEEVDEIIAPAFDGEISILPNHVNLFTRLKHGEMIIKKNGKSSAFAVMGGFLEISDNKINVLADYAIRAEDIEIAKAQQASERAKKLVEERKGKEDLAIAEGELMRSILELRVAKKYHPKFSSRTGQ
jgi:F-type H+-transporting ATPase subunit epsilon